MPASMVTLDMGSGLGIAAGNGERLECAWAIWAFGDAVAVVVWIAAGNFVAVVFPASAVVSQSGDGVADVTVKVFHVAMPDSDQAFEAEATAHFVPELEIVALADQPAGLL